MATPVTWQIKLAGSWIDLDASTSASLEAAFQLPTAQFICVSGSIRGGSVQTTFKDMFEANTMVWGSSPVRRTNWDTTTTCFEYWDNDMWVPYDIYGQRLLFDAMRIGRSQTALYIGSAEYDITLLDKCDLLQKNRDTGKCRPVRIRGETMVVDDDDDSDDGDITIADDDNMPVEYKCPITQMPMVKPVVAADGHSYEKRALECWLLTKKSSPTTGQTLKHTTLLVNINLKKLIRDFNEDKIKSSSVGASSSSSIVASASSVSASSSRKKMRLKSKQPAK